MKTSAMLRIFLIRHGRTALEGRYKGQIDLPLAPEGVKDMLGAALALKKILKGGSEGVKLNALYTSDLTRAIQSGDIIAKALGVGRVTPMALLRERAFGKWEGMRYDEIERMYPREFGLWVKDPFANSPVGGESSLAVKRRALASIKEITGQSRDGETLAIVSHSGILRVLLCYFLGMPYRNIFRADIGFGGISLVELYDGKTPVVRFMNFRPQACGRSAGRKKRNGG
ncbi:MAG: histidine phosphatase family protein [Nitrospiraceae bacterium]|nr:histidine phosphatase family protein [Nitrospiraceae bacterium]